MPSGISRSFAICQPAPASTRTTRLCAPAPTSCAKAARILLNRAVFTPSATTQETSPVAGRTKPNRQRLGAGVEAAVVAQPVQAELVVAADQLADPARREAGDVGHQLGGKAARQQPDDVKMAALDDGGSGLVQALQLSRRGVRNKMQGLGHAGHVALPGPVRKSGSALPPELLEAVLLVADDLRRH